MDKKDLYRALEIARHAAVEAGKMLRPHYGNVESLNKGDGDSVGGIVTKLDAEIEQYLADALAKYSDKIGFRGEELGTRSEAEVTWLVDPIDGTAHFVRGMPFCSTMIALIEKGTVVLSVIHNFITDETYWAIKDEGAYCNDTPISVSTRSLRQSILSFEAHLEKSEHYERFIQVRNKANIFDTLNSGYEFSMIASGKLDGRVSIDPYGMDWDFAPGSLLVTEAGGVAANIGAKSYDYRNHDFIISNKLVFDELTNGSEAIFPMRR